MTELGIIITTVGVILSALITQMPAILKEVRGGNRAEEDRKLATEALEAMKKEIEAIRDDRDSAELELLGEKRRNELMITEIEWLRTQCPHVKYQGPTS